MNNNTLVFTVDDIGEKIPTLFDNYPNMLHINIKTEGVEKLLNNLDPSKATGPDEIPACIFQMSILLPVN